MPTRRHVDCPVGFIRFLPVSRYWLERASGVWRLERGVLTPPCGGKWHGRVL